MSDPFFRDSCEDFKLANCAVGTTHIDPCSCNKFYKCNTGLSVISASCPNGTAFNHVDRLIVCGAEDNVILRDELCKVQAPWLRCNYTTNAGERYKALAARCGQGTTLAPVDTREVGSSSDTGAIVGAVLGVIIVLLIIGIVVLLWRKKYFEKVHSRFSKRFTSEKVRKSVQNPQYMIGESIRGSNQDENYSTIDEAMHDPTYNPDNLRGRDPSLPPRRFDKGRGTDSPSLNYPSLNVGRTDNEAFYVEPNKGGPTVKGGMSFDNLALQLDNDDPHNPSYVEMTDRVDTAPTQHDVRQPTPYDNSWNGT